MKLKNVIAIEKDKNWKLILNLTITAIVLSLFHVWYFEITWNYFKFIVFAFLLITEISYLITSQNPKKTNGYMWILITVIFCISIFLVCHFKLFCPDKYLRMLGGKKNYLGGVALQQLVFFFWIPRWLATTFNKWFTWTLTVFIFVIFHLFNWGLVLATFLAGIIFALIYYKKGFKAFSIVVVLHYILGSLIQKIFHFSMMVGILLEKKLH